jgi:hypothetical protein
LHATSNLKARKACDAYDAAQLVDNARNAGEEGNRFTRKPVQLQSISATVHAISRKTLKGGGRLWRMARLEGETWKLRRTG